jgi:outer membrane protein
VHDVVLSVANKEIDGTYFVTDNLALEIIAGTTKHTISNVGGSQLGSVWLLPPTVTAQYHFTPDGSIRPYVGAGVNYTIFYDATDAGTLAPHHLGYSNNFGWALQAGADIPVGSRGVFLNVDVKKIFLSTNVKLDGVKLGTANVDPWVISLGVGMKL